MSNLKLANDYFLVGREDDIVVSSSSIKHLMPTEDGSPAKFKLQFTEDKETLTGKWLDTGKAIHFYCEHFDKLEVLEIDKPSEKLGEVADTVIDLYMKDPMNAALLGIEQIVLQACRIVGWNPKYGDEAIIKNAFPSVAPYANQMIGIIKDNKLALSKADKEVLAIISEKLKANKLISSLLWGNEFEIYSEKPIYWTTNVNGVDVKRKALLDKINIDHSKKIIRIVDVKTTSKSVYNFSSSTRELMEMNLPTIGTFDSYRIGRQLFYYREAVKAEFSKLIQDGYIIDYYIVACETKRPHNVRVFSVPTHEILKHRKEVDWALNEVAHCLKTNQWETYSWEKEGEPIILNKSVV